MLGVAATTVLRRDLVIRKEYIKWYIMYRAQ